MFPGARRNSSFITSMMLGVLINFDEIDSQFFQKKLLSSPFNPFNEIWLNFESSLLKI